MSNSYTPPDRSTYDPGWNDPPPMPSMTSQPTVGAGKPRTSLNKRVAFPMQSSAVTGSNVKTTAEGLPLPFSTAKYQPPPSMPTALVPEAIPTPPTAVLPPPPSMALNPSVQTMTTEAVSEHFDSAVAREFLNSVFARLIDAMTIDAGKLGEIKKRLEVLDQMWQENKLNEAAQKNLYEFAKALENKDATAAMEQNRLLATQHINVSTQWATALRQLILSISSESETESQDAPATLQHTDVVQFVDVSTKPIVVDSAPFNPQEPTVPNPVPAPTNSPDSVPSESTVQSSGENATKSKFGRFGRILHI